MLDLLGARPKLGLAALTLTLITAGCGDDASSASDDGGSSTGDTGPSATSNADASSDGSSSSGSEGETGDTETTGGEVVVCDDLNVGESPLRRLTREQYANSVRDIFGLIADTANLDADEKAGAFDSNYSASVSPNAVEEYRALAEELATESVGDLETLAPCDAEESECTNAFVSSIGRRLFRRPLTAVETERYQALAASGTDYADGIRLVVQTMLQSGNFLYHLEFGLPGNGDVVELSDYELASRLSFFLWNSAPDDELLNAAEAGDLASVEGLRVHAERLLEDSRARDAVGSFHEQWLALDHLDTEFKDPAYYPQFDAALVEAMQAESRRFSQIVVLQGDGKLETLLTADYSYIEGPLFDLYDIERPEGHNAGMPVQMDPNERAGLLTQAAFLTAHALPNASGPIQRGVEVRSNILCSPPPPPPPGVNAIPPTLDPDSTTREIFEMHTAQPACAGCHVLIDGIGLGFEAYDGVGVYRETENGKPIDDLGQLAGTDVDGDFNGAVELASMLSQSEHVRECVSRQWFRFAFGRFEADQDECSLDVMYQAFEQSDFNVRELLLHVVETNAFRYRRAN